MASSLSTLLALLSLDNSEYLAGLTSSQAVTDDFTTKLSNVGGAVVVGGLSLAAGVITGIGMAAWDAGKTFNEAYDSIEQKTGATGDKLKGLKGILDDVFTDVPTDANSAAIAISGLNSHLGLTGEALLKVTEPLLEVTRMTGGDLTTNTELFTRVIGDANIPVDKVASSLDALYKAAQNTGAPLDQLMERVVQYGAPMRNFGFSFDESAALLAKWEKEGVNVETVMAGMRIAQGHFVKEGVDMKTGLWDTVAAIQNATSKTEGLGIAFKVFGAKNAGDMYDTIKAGKFNIDDLVTAMQSADGQIMKTAGSTMDVTQKWKLFNNQITSILGTFGLKMQDAAGQGIDALRDLFSRSDVMGQIDQIGTFVGQTISRIVTYIPVLISGLFTFITFLQNNQGVIVGIFAALGVSVVAWVGGVVIPAIGALITGFGGPILVMAAVGAAGYLLYQAWQTDWGGIREKTATVWASLQPLFIAFQNMLSVAIPAAIGFLQTVFTNTMQFIQDLTSGKLGWMSEIWARTWSVIQLAFGTNMAIIQQLLAALTAAFSGDWDTFGQHIGEAWNLAWGMLVIEMQASWANLMTVLGTLASNIWNVIVTAAQGTWNSVVTWFSGLWNSLLVTFQTIWGNITTWFANASAAVIAPFAALWTNILLPALRAVQVFLQPFTDLFIAVGNLLLAVVGLAITAFAGLWQNILLPAIQAVVGFIVDVAMAVWSDLVDKWNFIAGVVTMVTGVIIYALIAAWQPIAAAIDVVRGVVETATKAVIDFLVKAWEPVGVGIDAANKKATDLATVISGALQSAWQGLVDIYTQHIKPAFQWLGDFLGGKLLSAWQGITGAVKDLTGFIDKLADKLRKIKLPAALTPGSPTPFEIGLRGIGDAMNSLSHVSMPSLSAALNLEPTLAPAFSGGIDGQMSVSTATGNANGAGGGNDALLQEVYRMLRDQPNTLARAVRDVFEKARR